MLCETGLLWKYGSVSGVANDGTGVVSLDFTDVTDEDWRYELYSMVLGRHANTAGTIAIDSVTAGPVDLDVAVAPFLGCPPLDIRRELSQWAPRVLTVTLHNYLGASSTLLVSAAVRRVRRIR